jgi:hypothetical protein
VKSGYLLAAVAAFAISAPAMAGDKDHKDAQNAQETPKEKKICRTESVTGSLIAKQRICKTRAEWDELAANTSKTLNDGSRRQNSGSESGSANGANNTAGLGGF